MSISHLTKPVAGVVLAAGKSLRLGQPKQLVPLGGKILVQWVVEAALASRLTHVFLVLGHRSASITGALGELTADPRLTTLVNPDYGQGQSTSIHCGLRAAGTHHGAAMFLMGDQPLVGADIIDRLLAAFQASEREMCVPFLDGRRTTPAIFSERYYDKILATTGDTGPRALIDGNPAAVLRLEFPDPAPFLDIDDPADLERAQRAVALL